MFKPLSVLFITAIFVCSISFADDNTGQVKEYPKFKLGFSERLRLVTWDNAITLSEETNGTNAFTRHRTSVMGQFYANPDLELALKLTNEFRYYFVQTARKYGLDEIFIDQLYIKWHNKYYLPGTLTLGRQNILLGEWFTFMDGSPLDGSRCIYFNAARYDWNINKNWHLTLAYVYQDTTDEYLPTINERHQHLIEQPEEGIVAYLSGQFPDGNRKSVYDAYYIRKNIKRTTLGSYESRINTVGSRGEIKLDDNWLLAAEAAFQFGKYIGIDGRRNRSAIGTHFHVDYSIDLDEKFRQTLVLGEIYLSGDNRSTATYENWDPLFARWPKWSESYIYTQINEGGVANWTNMTSIYGRVIYKFGDNLSFNLDYHHLRAIHAMSASSSSVFGAGINRGRLIIGKFNYRVDEHLTGHFLWEWFDPGDFYFDDADSYSWVRAELMYSL
ncbi:MAG: hypothetical protein CVT49_09770 [candidate division Zixibacteria bacterium HGW-Zixibacteria-1]|nr:MAG: hypothetical protein CVT49_09770 [candidate division Zixibacteria bacterium HGW-Zixibacteria-1]